jgi:glyoxylase-like metal-dependent hydrolase (beta-lactamase superfamily II)
VGIETVVSPFLAENCYMVTDSRERVAVVVDPGVATAASVLDRLAQRHLTCVAVLLTHCHPDHLWDAAAVSEASGAPVLLNEADAGFLVDPLAGLAAFGLPGPAEVLGGGALWRRPDRVEFVAMADGAASIVLESLRFRALACPGHTPGSTVFEVGGAGDPPWLLTGDVLFRDGIGRTDLPGGDPAAMGASLRGLIGAFDHDRPILPGHGPGSTLRREVTHSPFLAAALEV